MDYGFDFVADRIVKDKASPAFSRHTAEPYTPAWRQFVNHWPNTVPVELHEHCYNHSYPMRLHSTTDGWPSGAYYTVGIGFFNFGVDYFSLMSDKVLDALRQRTLTVLFYYHEGDNPAAIKRRLDNLCDQNYIPINSYRFVSGNTAADNIKGFVYFPDHELLYWHRNCAALPTPVHNNLRDYNFTVLSRTHKWWRATVMTDLYQQGLLTNSYWSYGIDHTTNESIEDNPIEIDTLNLRSSIENFLSNAPYTCDTLTSDQHNDHHITEISHYENSYCSIVLETHFDADGSGGAFLTEKIFKAIKHGHPFVIVGCAGSLAALRELGYRTFDHAIDNSYDTIANNTERWIQCCNTVKQLKQQNLHTWFESCRADILHNQQLFATDKYNRLNTLLKRLQNS